MPLQIVPATAADLSAAIAMEDRAHAKNPIAPALFPGPFPESDTTRIDHMVKEHQENPGIKWLKVIDTDLEAKGKPSMVSFAEWVIWGTDPKHSPQVWGPGTNPEACVAFFGALHDIWWKRFEGKRHAYLHLLHTDPDHQRRGAGAMLVKWGTDEADRLGYVSYLEATPEGRLLYEKCGFREVERYTVDLTKYGGPADSSSCLMLREPARN